MNENERTCTICNEPVILAYMPGDPEPVDTLHVNPFGLDHDAITDTSDVEDRIYGRPPEGFFD
jgi:hypothetical protein